MRYLAIVDGEHYPPVVVSALQEVAARGHEVVAAVLAGGREKLPATGVDSYGGVPVISGSDPRPVFDRALVDLRPDRVLDLSDEPVLDYRLRHEMASIALYRRVPYEGMDFTFAPPPRPHLCESPSLAVIGTGKRTGKTAVANYGARAFAADGFRPVVVAMGRGGPEEPEVLRGEDLPLTPDDLLALSESGRHAASDYVEDALLSRVPTVGCRRCGGGLAGGVGISNYRRGVELANELRPGVMVLEGSGSSIPPVHADATVLVVPSNCPPEHLAGYFGPYRLLLADLVLVTMAEYPFGTPPQVSSLLSRLREVYRPEVEAQEIKDGGRAIRTVRTVFRPVPNASVKGARVYVATTAPPAAAEAIRRHLEREQGCRVVGVSHSLSDRARLQADLEEGLGKADVLACEIKAAAVDTATRQALDQGLEVVYLDNQPVGVDGDDPRGALLEVAELAQRRFKGRSNEREKT